MWSSVAPDRGTVRDIVETIHASGKLHDDSFGRSYGMDYMAVPGVSVAAKITRAKRETKINARRNKVRTLRGVLVDVCGAFFVSEIQHRSFTRRRHTPGRVTVFPVESRTIAVGALPRGYRIPSTRPSRVTDVISESVAEIVTVSPLRITRPSFPVIITSHTQA